MQILKDLELIKWNLENKDKDVALQVINIVIKRYTKTQTPDIVDPAGENICLGCE